MDWEYLRSLIAHETIYDMLKSNPNAKLDGVLTKLAFQSRFMRIKQVCRDMTPACPFPDQKISNYAEHFRIKYGMDTKYMGQSMIEAVHFQSPGFSFLLRSGQASTSSKKAQNDIQRLHFIPEHLRVIPFQENELFVWFMIPNIFHRMNSLLRAVKFQKIMEKELSAKLNIVNKVKLFF